MASTLEKSSLHPGENDWQTAWVMSRGADSFLNENENSASLTMVRSVPPRPAGITTREAVWPRKITEERGTSRQPRA
jgi:hypothetical protein